MSDGILYRNASGKDVTHASYSARQTYRHCPREFQLTRVDGWSDKVQRAATLFGRAIEAGLQAYEENDRKPNSGRDVFVKLWNDVKLLPEFAALVFTGSEKDWQTLMESGRQMMRLYEIKAPSLPIKLPVFQQTLRKKIFPGTDLDRIENKAIVDILSYPRWDHAMLTKIEANPDQAFRTLIIDVKTSGKDLATDLVALDPQLAEYAWQARVPDVAFLWFVKKGHELKKGSRITLLEDAAGRWAGWEGFVLEIDDPIESGQSPVYIASYDELEKYEAVVKNLRGKARDAAKNNYFQEAFADGRVASVLDVQLTKQRLQFASARLSEADMNDVGRTVAQTTVEMVRSHEQSFYEKQPGIRFPNEKCNFCSMRWICLNRPDKRDETLTRRGEEWLDGIQDEGNE